MQKAGRRYLDMGPGHGFWTWEWDVGSEMQREGCRERGVVSGAKGAGNNDDIELNGDYGFLED